MELTPVKSTNVEAVGYDHENKELYVRFKGSKEVYIYSAVDPSVNTALMAADSVGGFLHKNVKNKFKFRKVRMP